MILEGVLCFSCHVQAATGDCSLSMDAFVAGQNGASIPRQRLADSWCVWHCRKRALGYTSCGELIWDELFEGCWVS